MKFAKFFVVAAVAMIALAMAGCEDNKKSSKPPTGLNVSGLWRLSFDVGAVINMTFEQDTNGVVQGVGTDTGGTAWSFSGSIKDDRLSGKTIPDMTLSAIVDTNVMAGTYSLGSSHGSFTGARQ